MALRYLLALFAFLVASPAFAQGGSESITLTAERVEAVIAAFAPMRAELRELDESFGSDADANNYSSQLQALAIAGGVSGAVDSAAQENGFASFLDWVNHTNAVLIAHVFAANASKMDAEMQQALAQIDSQPGMSDAQKEQMKQMLMQSMAAVDAARPPEENIAAVMPYHDQIEAILAE
jgi:hypothetical protein